MKKRPFTILEVLIAIFLISLIAIPLIGPQTYMFVQQRKFVKEVELDRLISLVYSEIIVLLFENKINWNSIIGGEVMAIDPTFLKNLGFSDETLEWKGSFSFEKIINKPEPPSDWTVYLFKLTISFVPKVQGGETRQVAYEVFISRDVRQ